MSLLPRTRAGALWRALLSAVIVIGFVAGTTAVAGLLQIKQVASDFHAHKAITGISKQLALPAPGEPQTLLLIGVDHRDGEGDGIGNTDTMMLMRIDDSSSTINVLSIPRDLAVDIPGVGEAKINDAYASGGAKLLLQTLRQDVFPALQVDHILIIDFQGFADLVSSLGCVYAPVDHRYYNDNLGQSVANNYSSIDIQPGYQELCGGPHNDGGATSALAFVRFRHNDSDIVREARQQDFLRWAKSQWSTQTLLADAGRLEKEFADNVETDGNLQTFGGVDDLFDLAVNADGSSLKSIPFPYGPSEVVNGGDDLSFSETASAQAYQEFMTPTTTATNAVPGISTTSHKGKKKAHAKTPAQIGMVSDPGDGKSQAGQLGDVGMPVYYPRYIPEGLEYCFSMSTNCDEDTNPTSAYDNSYPRNYKINGPDDTPYDAYVMTLVPWSWSDGGQVPDLALGQYVTVQGTTWQDPPLLRDPSAVETVHGKVLDIYSQAGLVSTVAWHTSQGVYWIQNTLQNTIPNDQMVEMAASLTRAPA